MPPYLIACDFDGTITRRDTLHLIIEEFGDRAVWDALEPDLLAGRIRVEDAMEREFATVRAGLDEVRRMLRRRAGIRDGFHELVRWAEETGNRVIVFSNGFASVIADLLGRAGLGHLEVHSHDAEFTPEGARLIWAGRGERCSLCDRPCKRFDLARVREGATVAYIGDGVSDRCVAEAADVVFARAGLADYLAERSVPFIPFDDFHEVRAHLAGRVAA